MFGAELPIVLTATAAPASLTRELASAWEQPREKQAAEAYGPSQAGRGEREITRPAQTEGAEGWGTPCVRPPRNEEGLGVDGQGAGGPEEKEGNCAPERARL